ncbi:hypothetical protein CYY_008060 [Polysphondylium violaceum]|uniref:Elp3/MiaA/NifB-like radical SAM core domain-containing protein n=1 Tax=Polysphondylium violaceum TaxID=133409 RepID=A0A8J4UQF7_9MYCE|nr:hypothetical protein CYY_008060 [Polysphondylium violaceum]
MGRALVAEIEAFHHNYHSERLGDGAQINDRPLTSIYFGGGTPSLAKVGTFVGVMNAIRKLYPSADIEQCEITLEVNPDQKDLKDLLKDFKKYVGINRVSLGIQALNDTDLKYLGRTHTTAQAMESVRIAQDLFERITFDLIYARHPDQTLAKWEKELKEALAMTQGQGHLSLYTLCFEQGTNFHKRLNLDSKRKSKISAPDHNLSSDLYELTKKVTAERNFTQYEVSSFSSSPLEQSKHNKNYWRGGDYIGIGPGACSRITLNNKNNNNNSNNNSSNQTYSRYALKNTLHPKDWQSNLLTSIKDTDPSLHIVGNPINNHNNFFKNTFEEQEILSEQQVIDELLLMGLRTKEGVNLNSFKYYSNGKDFNQFLNPTKTKLFNEQGLLDIDTDRLVLTDQGLSLLDTIVPDLLLPPTVNK